MSDQPQKAPKEPRKTAAAELARIAQDMYSFSSVASEQGGNATVRYFATVRADAEATRRSLSSIRPALSMEYQLKNDGRVPSPSQLAAAMTTLKGHAEKNLVADDEEDGEEILLAARVVPVPRDRGLSLITARDNCPLPDGYAIPVPYVAAGDGIYLVRDDGGQARVTWEWLFPVHVYVDPAEDQMIELVWREGGRWVKRLVRRAIAKSGRKLVAEFGDAGLPATEAEARQAERWLAAAESANRKVIGRDQVARQLGWQSDGTFVTAQDSPRHIEPAYPDQVGPLKAHHPNGRLSAWKQTMEAAEPYVVVRAGAIAGLAPPLLEVLGLDSFAVDISGASTRGKTITAMVAMSCWADPSDKADAMLSWRMPSIFPIEKRLNLSNGLLVAIDETRLVKDPSIIDAVLYLVPKNHGQPRGGGWPNMIPWRVILLTTGEQPAVSFTTFQGASARILSITHRPPFGPEGDDGRRAAELVKRGVESNFGVAGPAFVAKLQAELAGEHGAEKLRARHDELTALLRGEGDMAGRRAPLIACLALAGELACAWDILPGTAPEPDEWLPLFTTPDLTDNRPEMALDVIRELVAGRSGDLWFPGRDWQPSQGWIGRYYQFRDNGVPTVALLPGVVRRELQRRKIEYDAILPGWREDKVLREYAQGREPHLISAFLAGTRTRMLIFEPGQIEVKLPEAKSPEQPPRPDAPLEGGEDE